MSTFQITSSQPSICFRNMSQSLRPSPKLLLLPTCLKPTYNASIRQPRMPVLKAQQCRVLSKYHQSAPVCLLGSKGKSESGDEGSPWKALEKAMGNLKKVQSIEDVLRQQIEKNEFYEERGGGGGSGSGGGGGRGGGGGGDDAGGSGSEDEGLAGIMDETLQVILATFGFIFLYFYIISGEELTRLAKDYIKFLLSGSKSIRLQRSMYKWVRFYKNLTKKEEYDKFWLEKAIITTPTWWDSPEKYRHIIRSNIASNSDE